MIPPLWAPYERALDWLYGYIDYESRRTAAYTPENYNLERTRELLALCGNPERGMKLLHVAGTKGKGSTCLFAARILESAGYRVGLFTSPHIVKVSERFTVNGRLIPQKTLVRLVNRLRRVVPRMRLPPTTFELFTALAFLFFRDRNVDWAVLETGMGGRLDSTNVCSPRACAITSVSYDHTDKLGHRLSCIMREKAGIVKRGIPVVSAPQRPEAMRVLCGRCRAMRAPLCVVGRDVVPRVLSTGARGSVVAVRARSPLPPVRLPLRGRFQPENLAVAWGLVLAAGVRPDPKRAVAAIERVRFAGRMEKVGSRPTVLLDGAHNADSARRLRESLADHGRFERLHLLVGILADKDVPGILRGLSPADRVTVTVPDTHRPVDGKAVAREARRVFSRVRYVPRFARAWREAKAAAAPGDLLLVTGSLYTVASVKNLPRANRRHPS